MQRSGVTGCGAGASRRRAGVVGASVLLALAVLPASALHPTNTAAGRQRVFLLPVPAWVAPAFPETAGGRLRAPAPGTRGAQRRKLRRSSAPLAGPLALAAQGDGADGAGHPRGPAEDRLRQWKAPARPIAARKRPAARRG